MAKRSQLFDTSGDRRRYVVAAVGTAVALIGLALTGFGAALVNRSGAGGPGRVRASPVGCG